MDKICVCKHFTSLNCTPFGITKHECSCVSLKDITNTADLVVNMKFVYHCRSDTHVINDCDKLPRCVCRYDEPELSGFWLCKKVTNSNVEHECLCDLGFECSAKKGHKCKCLISKSWDDGYLDFECYADDGEHVCTCKSLTSTCKSHDDHICICGNNNGCKCLSLQHTCICNTRYERCRSTTHDIKCYCSTHGPYKCRSLDTSLIHNCICELGYKTICKGEHPS